jgi:hypothetical protein
MLGEHHVLRALEHAQLRSERTWGLREVRRGDHLEHQLTRSSDAHRQRTKRLDRPADAKIDADHTSGDEAVEATPTGADRKKARYQASDAPALHLTRR